MSIRGAGAAWSPMVNKFGSAWEVATTPSLPWDFQFTSDSGQSVSQMQMLRPFCSLTSLEKYCLSPDFEMNLRMVLMGLQTVALTLPLIPAKANKVWP